MVPVQVLVVAEKGRESIARKLAYAISKAEIATSESGDGKPSSTVRPFTSAMWTVKHYEDNEAGLLSNTVGVVFVGQSGPARDFRDELPSAFASMGTSCHAEGRRAVLWAEVPSDIDLDELRGLGEQLGAATSELVKRIERMGKVGAALAGRAVLANHLRVPADGVLLIPATVFWAVRRRDRKRLIAKVNEAQYSYLAARFIADVLPSFLDD